VRWSYSGSVYDLTRGDDRFRTGMDALVAEREAENLRDATVRAMVSRAQQGLVGGPLPDGFRRVHDPRTGKVIKYELDPVRSQIIKEAVERVLSGESAYAVAHGFNDRGIRTRHGNSWTGASLSRTIRSPALAGLRQLRGEVLQGVESQWPALIVPEQHYRLRELFNDPRRRTNKEGSKVRHMSSGIFRCGVCDGPVQVRSRARKDGSRQHRYACKPGFHVSRDQEEVDAFVSAVVVRFLSRPDVAAELAETEQDDDTVAARAEVARLKGLLTEARGKVRTGALSLVR